MELIIILLDMSFDEITNIVKDFEIRDLEEYSVITCGNVRIWVNNDTDKASQILVKNGFEGKYDNKIGLGSTLNDIVNMGYEWYEELDAYFIRGIDGFCFELADVENLDDEWDELSAPIEYICVFDKSDFPDDDEEEYIYKTRDTIL